MEDRPLPGRFFLFIDPEQQRLARLVDNRFQPEQKAGANGGAPVTLADIIGHGTLRYTAVPVQHHGSLECIIVDCIKPVQLVRITPLAGVGLAYLVFTQRSTAAAYNITVPAAFQPVFEAIAMCYRCGGLYAVFFKIIDKETVLPGRQAHIYKKTQAAVEPFF